MWIDVLAQVPKPAAEIYDVFAGDLTGGYQILYEVVDQVADDLPIAL